MKDLETLMETQQLVEPQMIKITKTSTNYFSFRLHTGFPDINKGVNAGITIDLDGKTRPVGQPDLGCFEKQ